jgi:SOS response regulatory protein OraA/RecX
MKLIDLSTSRQMAGKFDSKPEPKTSRPTSSTPKPALVVAQKPLESAVLEFDDFELPEITSKKYNLPEQVAKPKEILKPYNPDAKRDIFGNEKKIVDTSTLSVDEEYQNCRSYMLVLIGQKDYSVATLTQKSIEKGYLESTVEQIIQEFTAKKWVDDERMANNIVSFYSGNKGKIWIMQKLIKKQLPKDLCQKVLASFEEVEEITDPTNDYNFLNKPKSLNPNDDVKRLIERKYKITNWQNLDPKIKNKVIYFLSSRGFTGAFNILKEWERVS